MSADKKKQLPFLELLCLMCLRGPSSHLRHNTSTSVKERRHDATLRAMAELHRVSTSAIVARNVASCVRSLNTRRRKKFLFLVLASPRFTRIFRVFMLGSYVTVNQLSRVISKQKVAFDTVGNFKGWFSLATEAEAEAEENLTH